jgi:ATP-dependent Clp protease adapter protein ClpS
MPAEYDSLTATPGSGSTVLDHDYALAIGEAFDKGWNVILHNDDVTPFQVVIGAIMQIMSWDVEKAAKAAATAHEKGKTILVGPIHEERAEHIVECFKEFKITATMEKNS